MGLSERGWGSHQAKDLDGAVRRPGCTRPGSSPWVSGLQLRQVSFIHRVLHVQPPTLPRRKLAQDTAQQQSQEKKKKTGCLDSQAGELFPPKVFSLLGSPHWPGFA